MTEERFTAWLDAYGRAWEARDTKAAVALFTPDVEYHESPFDPPFRGSEGVRRYWTETTGAQREIQFTHRPVAVVGPVGVAHWHARFVRVPSGEHVELDGVLILDFAADGRCEVLREWWHTAQGQDA